MTDRLETPFDSIDSAREYVRLLCEALRDARTDVAEDVQVAIDEGAQRRLEALQLASYKLDRLESHLEQAGVLLNDLRMLRRLLLGEPSPDPSPPTGTRQAADERRR